MVDAVRGKSAVEAMTILTFIPKRAGLPIKKLVASAMANARNFSLDPETLIVKAIRVDGGPTLKRRRPRSHGMANPIKKRTSRVSVVLTEPK